MSMMKITVGFDDPNSLRETKAGSPGAQRKLSERPIPYHLDRLAWLPSMAEPPELETTVTCWAW